MSVAINLECTCGSGGHPRRCVKHPEAYQKHVASIELDDLVAYFWDLYAQRENAVHRSPTEAAAFNREIVDELPTLLRKIEEVNK